MGDGKGHPTNDGGNDKEPPLCAKATRFHLRASQVRETQYCGDRFRL